MIQSIRAQAFSWIGSRLGGESSLRRRTLVGSQWLILRSLVQAGLEVIKVSVFARLLFPEDYGLMALAALPIGLLDSFSATGLDLMVQREGEDYEKRLADYWTIRIVRGVLLFLLAWFAALPLAAYYQRPELIPLVRFLGLGFVFDGASGFGREIRQRRMQFARVALADCLVTAALLAAGLTALFYLRNCWALAVYQVASSFLYLIVSFALFPWKPRWHWDRSVWLGVAGFAGSIVAINVLNYFFSNFDKSLIGKTLGVEQLGLYSRGYFLALIPAIYCFNAVAPVMLSSFRSLVGEPARMAEAFRKTALAFLLLGALGGLLLFAGARELVLLLYGEKWLPVVPVFRVLIIFSISKSIVSVCTPVFFLKDRQWQISAATLAMVVVFALLCFPLTLAYGIVGTAWAVTLSGVASHGLAFVLAWRALIEFRSGPLAANPKTVETRPELPGVGATCVTGRRDLQPPANGRVKDAQHAGRPEN
jgi:O-antigen/teichoic acid export membrane protein